MAITFTGTRRFQVLRKLGEGGMGAVYEAHDQETGARVALKTLLFSRSDTLLRFKEEFRHFQHIAHSNLVSLGDLYEEDGLWFFTMELIDGTDFLSHVRVASLPFAVSPDARTITANIEKLHQIVAEASVESEPQPQSGEIDLVLLRDKLVQLSKGLMALHDAGKVHRDVKPSNVLVNQAGRVVLLDFGIATDLSRREQLVQSRIMGTPHYMAPEQAAGMPVAQSADWYSVGVVLYEALTGRLPFEGSLLKVIEDKQWQAPKAPQEYDVRIPADLNDLCMDLLNVSAEARPAGKAIIERLGGKESASRLHVAPSHSRSDTHTMPFVGREAEMGALHQTFDDVQRTRAGSSIYVFGESGVGKSALVSRFAEEVRVRNPEAVVLSGRCHEHEAVPYKAVDGVVDDLSRYLARLPKEKAAGLIPRYPTLLAQAFPVLWRIEAIAEHPRPRSELDPRERRTRVFAALRELFARMADRGPLVVAIDDMQWADLDSLNLLGELLRPPDAPALLLLATVRTESDGRKPPFTTGPTAVSGVSRQLHVTRLAERDAQELASLLVKRAGATHTIEPELIVREAGGHPLFIDELVRHRVALGDEGARPSKLEDALWGRIGQLEPLTRKLLEIICLAPGALTQATATKAALIESAEAVRHVKRLKAAHFARTTGGTRGTDLIEPYHGRVRESVRNRLSEDERRAIHRKLAVVLETSGQKDPEALAVHWLEAGDNEKAEQYAVLAADRAADALAFDRAAQFYATILDIEPPSSSLAQRIRIKLADALANAGRGERAAQIYVAAAQEANASDALDLHRRAAEQYLTSGHIDEGLAMIDRVLTPLRMSLPTSRMGASASLLARRARVRLRGLGFHEHHPSEVTARTLAKIDVCWSVGTALASVDPLRAADLYAQNLLMALDAGEPYRVARALCMESAYLALSGTPDRAERAASMALELGERLGNNHAIGLAHLASAVVAFLGGKWKTTVAKAEVAEEVFRERCSGATRQLDDARLYRTWGLVFMGEFARIAAELPALLLEAQERGDLYLETCLRTRVLHVVRLCEDRAAEARAEVETAIRRWSRGGFFLQHFFQVISKTEIAVYMGEGESALRTIEENEKALLDSGLMRSQTMRIEWLGLRGRAELSAWTSSREPRLLARAAHEARALEKEETHWASALALLLRAGIAHARGSKGDALALLRRAVDACGLAELRMHAWAAEMAVAHTEETEEARDSGAAAVASMRGQHVVAPQRMLRLFLPTFADGETIILPSALPARGMTA